MTETLLQPTVDAWWAARDESGDPIVFSAVFLGGGSCAEAIGLVGAIIQAVGGGDIVSALSTTRLWIDITILDSGAWEAVVEAARGAVADMISALGVPEQAIQFAITWERCNLLPAIPEGQDTGNESDGGLDLHGPSPDAWAAVAGAHVVTCMYTIAELLRLSRPATSALFAKVLQTMTAGSVLLVADPAVNSDAGSTPVWVDESVVASSRQARLLDASSYKFSVAKETLTASDLAPLCARLKFR